MFERFSEKAIRVIMLAQEESRRLGHNFVGTEQLLLGLIAEGTSIASKTLKSMGASIEKARKEVENIIGRGSGFTSAEIPFTPRTKRVFELSLDEAQKQGKEKIETQHLLLSLIKENEGIAAKVLENLGINLDECAFLIQENMKNENKTQLNSKKIELPNEPKYKRFTILLKDIIQRKEQAILNCLFEKATSYREIEDFIEKQISKIAENLSKGLIVADFETDRIYEVINKKISEAEKTKEDSTNINIKQKNNYTNEDNYNNSDRSFEGKFKRLKETFLDLFRL